MIQYLQGDCRDIMKTLPETSVHCCVTSPPYWGLRDYDVDGQIGLEISPEEHLKTMVDVFRELKRVLRDDGTVWINYGDSYWNGGVEKRDGGHDFVSGGKRKLSDAKGQLQQRKSKTEWNLKPKDMIGMPWRVALALQEDGWYLRSDIIWHKPNPMPESVTDRPTKAHEYIFLLTKSPKYFYDAEAIKEQGVSDPVTPWKERKEAGEMPRHGISSNAPSLSKKVSKQRGHGRRHAGFNDRWDDMTKQEQCSVMRNKRDVWTVATSGYPGAHFATFPPELIRPCILAGCPLGGTVLDPFGGSGTTAQVAEQEGRNCILIELNKNYIELQKSRTQQTSLLCNE